MDRRSLQLFRYRSTGVFLLVGILFLPILTWGQAKPGAKPAAPAKGVPPPAGPPTGVRVNVGVSTAKPGDIIDIPLTLSMPESFKVSGISEVISFPKKALSLTKAELGLAGEQSQAEIKTEVKDDGSDPESARLEVSVTSKVQMKPGILAYLKFKVSEQATKSTVVLKLLDSKAEPANLEVAKGKDGEVTIFNLNEEIPVVGCFFFSH